MAAPKNNKNAVGNSGGKSLNDRKLAAEVRSLALGHIKEILQPRFKDKQLQNAVILKLASTLLPRLNEHTGEDGEAIKHAVTGFNYITPHDTDNRADAQTTSSVAEVAG